jgi:hypothetical protein
VKQQALAVVAAVTLGGPVIALLTARGAGAGVTAKSTPKGSGREKPPLQDVATNLEVTCTAKTRATFTFDLQLKQPATGVTTPPLGLHQPGEAVLRKGTWYVTAPTACAFTALNPDPANQAPVVACYQALGRPVPVPTT